jgi:phage/plasmid-associated DNA primase
MAFNEKRIAISNEMSMNRTIDGNILKTLASGGDTMQARRNYQDEETIVNRATLFIMVNDIPKIQPVDAGLRNRLGCAEFNCRFVANEPVEANERKADEDIKDKFKRDKAFRNALVHVMRRAYRETRRFGNEQPDLVKKASESWVSNDNSLMGILNSGFAFTKNKEDVVAFEDMYAFAREKGVQVSKARMGKELGKELGPSSIERPAGGGKPRVCYRGVRHATACQIDDSGC